jgi:Uma2 family endonuclease
MSTKALMTVEQFAEMTTADTENYELVEGELVPLSSGTPFHAKIQRKLMRLLEDFLAAKRSGECYHEIDCRTEEDSVRRPDVSVFLGDRAQRIDPYQIPVPFAPDIAVEVLSPSEKAGDMHRKVNEYLAAGAAEVWILDEANQIVFIHSTVGIRRLNASESIESPLLPGFRAGISALFTF